MRKILFCLLVVGLTLACADKQATRDQATPEPYDPCVAHFECCVCSRHFDNHLSRDWHETDCFALSSQEHYGHRVYGPEPPPIKTKGE